MNCRTDSGNMSDIFVGQMTTLSEQNIFVGHIQFVQNIVSEFCRTELLFVGQKIKFVICRTNPVRLFVFVGQNLSDRQQICRTDSSLVGQIHIGNNVLPDRICRTDADLSDRKNLFNKMTFVEQICSVFFCACRTEICRTDF